MTNERERRKKYKEPVGSWKTYCSLPTRAREIQQRVMLSAQGSLTWPGPTGCCKIAVFRAVLLGSRSRGLGRAGGYCLQQVPPAQSDLGEGSRVESGLGP